MNIDAELTDVAIGLLKLRADPDFATEMQGLFVGPKPIPGADAVDVEERHVPGPAGAPPVRVRIYRAVSSSSSAAGTSPAALLAHGGGFTIGDLELDHDRALRLAIDGITVMNVDYRLAPDHRFPAAPEDCYAALCYLAAHADELGVDPDRIALSGPSAGGNLAAAVALLARDRGGPVVAFQHLIYPALDDRPRTASRRLRGVPVVDADGVAEVWDAYLGDQAHQGDEVSPYAAPARASDLSGLPPAYILTVELDPLRDEAILYGMRLLEAGVSTEIHNIPAVFHGFQGFDADVCRRCIDEIHDSLVRGLTRPAATVVI